MNNLLDILAVQRAKTFVENNMYLQGRNAGRFKFTVTLKNDTIYFEWNNVVEKRVIDIEKLEKMFSELEYGDTNPFYHYDTVKSPLEADRVRRYNSDGTERYKTYEEYLKRKVWVEDYPIIGFPRFMPTIYSFIYANNRIPNIPELCLLFKNLYTEVVPLDERMTEEELAPYYYREFYGWQYKNQKIVNLVHNGTFICQNEIIRFKKKFVESGVVFKLPFNEFTTEALFSRIYKIYGPCVRDIHFCVKFYICTGRNTLYSLKQDYNGTDVLIDGKYKVANFTKTIAAEEMDDSKNAERRKNGKNNIVLIADISDTDGLVFVDENTMLKIDAFIKQCEENPKKEPYVEIIYP